MRKAYKKQLNKKISKKLQGQEQRDGRAQHQ